MKALMLNLIILIGMTMVTGSCEKSSVTPCVKGVPVETVGNCYLIIRVLNAPIGKTFTYTDSNKQPVTYENVVQTSLTLKNLNRGDTVYFIYESQNYGAITCPFGPGTGSSITSTIPTIKVLSFSAKNCPQ